MLQYLRLLPVILITGCASMHDMVCSLVEPDSYVLVSIVRCQTMRTSFDYATNTDFSLFESYAWAPADPSMPDGPQPRPDSRVSESLTQYIDARLSEKGFLLDHAAPDFLVTYDIPVEMRGSLTLTFMQADGGRVIWRGSVDDEAYPARNADAWEARIRTAADMLLDQFPPVRHQHAGAGDAGSN